MNGFTFGFSNKPYIWMDPRTKVLLFITANIVGFLNRSLIILTAFIVFALLLLIDGKLFKQARNIAVFYLALLLLKHFVAPMLHDFLLAIYMTIEWITRIFIPIIVTVIFLFSTTTVSEFIAAFDKIKLTKKIVIPFTIMFRFIPTIAEEWRNIQNAMKMRGISMSFSNVITRPMKAMEYTVVPVLMSAAKVSDELTAASLARGLDVDSKSSCIQQIKFGMLDYICLLICIAFIVLSITIGR